MKRLRNWLCFFKLPLDGLLVAGLLCAGDPQGIPPRRDVRLYHGTALTDRFEMGATLLSAEQVKKSFVTAVAKDYAVVEVAIYPKDGQSIDVNAWDFALQAIGTDQTARAVRPRTVAGVLQKSPPRQNSGVDVYPSANIGYESSRSYDPVYGDGRNPNRRGGWYGGTGVGVGVGQQGPPATSDRDRRTMELELSERGLPEGATAQPVAGYVYFPLTTKKKDASYELEYDGPNGPTKLTLGRR